jgi:hypothetical protein
LILKIKAIHELNPVHTIGDTVIKLSMMSILKSAAGYQIILTPPDEVG